MSDRVHISFLPSRVAGEVPRETTILQAARLLGLAIEAPCSTGTCGRDLVQLRVGTRLENVLACQHRLDEDAEVTLPSQEEGNVQIVEGFFGAQRRPVARSVPAALGIAVDLGTTTLAAALVDLPSGKVLGRTSTLTPLVRYGHDVVTRIRYATAEKHGLRRMHAELRSAVNLLIRLLCSRLEKEPALVGRVVASGNTTMQHIFLGKPISSLGEFPYTAETLDAVTLSARDAGIGVAPGADVTTFPCMSAYVGGDIASGLVALDLDPRDLPTLFIDIGTNGEVVLAAPGGWLGASTAAGPCFEGMCIACGMRAAPGAIQHVDITGNAVTVDVIAGGTPRGVCGSGLLDAVAELRRAGLVSPSGRIAPPAGDPLFEKDGKRCARLADGVFLTQEDIRQVQLAKAAIRAGVDLLLLQARLRAEDLKRVVVAGGFGYHLRERSLLEIGMLPPVVGSKVHYVGNSSLEGSVRALLDPSLLESANRIARSTRVVDLATLPEFPSAFYGQMHLAGEGPAQPAARRSGG